MSMNAETFINNMLGEMIDQIVNGQATLPKDQREKLKDKAPFKNGNFFTWCTPGIPVTAADFAFLKGLRKPIDFEKFKDLSEEDKKTLQGDEAYSLTVAMDNFSILVDTVPNKSGAIDTVQVWEPQNRISHIYESILKSSEVADSIPSPDAEERIKKIRSEQVAPIERTDAETGEKFTELGPSRIVAAYNKQEQAYGEAWAKYVEVMTGALTGSAADVQKASMLGPRLSQDLKVAEDMWETIGFKSKVEKMTADLAQLEGISMSLLKREYMEIFNKCRQDSLIDFTAYNVSRLVPASFFESNGWTNFSFTSSQLSKTDLTKTKKYSGGARYGFLGGAKGKFEKLDRSSSIDFEKFEMSFELTQAPIVRAWFREDFLMSNKWRIKTGSNGSSIMNAGDLLSNGDPENPQGKLFAYPTVVIFARNIKVSKTIYDKMSSELSVNGGGDGGFSLGPFSMGGKASYNKTEKNITIKQEGERIVVPGMQIIGFRNHVLPLCPNPDPTIKNWI